MGVTLVQSHSWVRRIDRGSSGSPPYQMPTPLLVGVKCAIFCPPKTCVISPAADHTHYLASFHMGLDLVGPFKKAKGGFTHIFVTVDKFTKWVEVKPASSITAAKAVEFVKEIMYRFGIPNNIITDNGT
jgi:hypothetical protein